MPIEYFQVDVNNIREKINSEEFYCFKNEIESMLQIQDMKCEVSIQEYYKDNNGFEERNKNANAKFLNNYKEFDKIYFFVNNLKEDINRKFPKIFKVPTNTLMYNKIMDIFIRTILVHELIHVQQFKNEEITEEIVKNSEGIPYREKCYEINANNKAREIISNYGVFEARVVKYVLGDISMNLGNDRIKELILELLTLFKSEYNA